MTSRLAKKYRQPSFRGVEFKISDVNGNHGRRVTVYQYPFKNKNSSKDLGLKARSFSFDAYVLGENYEAQRDALIAACEAEGPGVLVHPYLGTKNVVCSGCNYSEGKSSNGAAFFSLSFDEVGDEINPSVGIDGASKLKNTVAELQAVSSAAFEKIYAVADAPSFVTDSAEEKLNTFTDVVDFEAQKINGLTQKLADYTYQIRNMKADITSIASAPGRVAQNMVTTLNNFLAVLPGGTPQMKVALTGITRYGSAFDTSSDSTSTRAQESENARALRDLNFEVATGLLASEAVDRIYTSFEDAQISQHEVLDLIDQILERTRDDDVFAGFHRMRVEVIKAVPNPNQGLPRIVSVEYTAQLPSLVIAYDIYENLDLEQDIIERNNISNPGFMPAQSPIQVLRFSSG